MENVRRRMRASASPFNAHNGALYHGPSQPFQPHDNFKSNFGASHGYINQQGPLPHHPEYTYAPPPLPPVEYPDGSFGPPELFDQFGNSTVKNSDMRADNDPDYGERDELPPGYDWRSVARSRSHVPDIMYRLDVFRKCPGNDKENFALDGFYVQDKPFDVKVRSVETVPDQEESTEQQETETAPVSPVFEVTQGALDFRYTTLTRPQLLQLSEVRITSMDESHIAIHSAPLREALRSLVKYYPDYTDDDFLSPGPMIVDAPYALLVHHLQDIQHFIAAGSPPSGESVEESQQVADMRILYNFLTNKYSAEIAQADSRLKGPTPKVEFDKLWYLFRPGQDVYVQSTEDVYACVICRVELDFSSTDGSRLCILDMWCLNTDGARIARVGKRATIRFYSGFREVTSLLVCPVDIWDAFDDGKRRCSMMQRSELYMQTLRNGSLYANYDGTDHLDGRHYHGKVVLDCVHGRTGGSSEFPSTPPLGTVLDNYNTYTSYDYVYVSNEALSGRSRELDDNFPRDGPPPPPPPFKRSRSFEGVDDSDIHMPQHNYFDPGAQAKARLGTIEITDHQLLLLYPRAPAFALSTKEWMLVSLDRVTPVKSSSESINNLVMVDENALQTIRALSARQNSKLEGWSADFIEGKGSGQIILLHGPPGVGKTFTVESIAAWLQRPLMALTVADVGTRETKVEKELLKWFDLAEAWNAVLLVDEADIFLEQRKTRDLARNGLVSAFLRRMEYFRGVLFLTTNRVGQIDDAFMSRVHVAIGYEALNLQARQAIWKGFFNKVSTEQAGKVVIGPSAKKFVLEDPFVQNIELNGRDIRNALQTAITLAEFETLEARTREGNELVIVEEAHFRRVLQMGEKFYKYITSIRREDEAKRANQRGDRNDYNDVLASN